MASTLFGYPFQASVEVRGKMVNITDAFYIDPKSFTGLTLSLDTVLGLIHAAELERTDGVGFPE